MSQLGRSCIFSLRSSHENEIRSDLSANVLHVFKKREVLLCSLLGLGGLKAHLFTRFRVGYANMYSAIICPFLHYFATGYNGIWKLIVKQIIYVYKILGQNIKKCFKQNSTPSFLCSGQCFVCPDANAET